MKTGSIWPAAIFGLIGLNVVIVGVTVYYATHDPSAAVEPQYYQKALAWDQTARLRDASDRLQWKAGATVDREGRLNLAITDASGAPVADAQVTATVFAVARASDRQDLTLTQTSPGVYSAAVRLNRGGLWQIRVDAKRGSDVFTCTIEQELTANIGGAKGPGSSAPVSEGGRTSP
jgi:nitrogen fixation protein FixH